MTDENISFPLLPSHAACALHGLAIAITDTVREEVSGDIARRTLHKINALATAQELIATELAHFFGSRMGDDHDELEAIQDRYMAEAEKKPAE